MIYDSSSFSFTPYHDSRGTHGISGPLLLAKDRKSGIQYLVKHTIRNDIGNEYLAHKLAIALNVPTTEAILIGQSPQFNLPYAVGIEYAEDFKRFNADRLIGNTQKDDDGVGTAIMSGDKDAEVPAPPKEPEYQDSDPFVTTLMRHMAFRYIINLDDNLQFATHDGKLIAFDFADSFTQNTSDILFFRLRRGYNLTLDIFHREASDELLNAYLDPILLFMDLQEDFIPSLLNDLNDLGIHTESYRKYFKSLSDAIQWLSA